MKRLALVLLLVLGCAPSPGQLVFRVDFHNLSPVDENVTVRCWDGPQFLGSQTEIVGPSTDHPFFFPVPPTVVEVRAGFGTASWTFPGPSGVSPALQQCPYWSWNVDYPGAYAYGSYARR